MTKLKVHGIGTITVKIENKIIELYDILYVPDIADTLHSIIYPGRQIYCLFVTENGDTTVVFTTFTLLAKTHK